MDLKLNPLTGDLLLQDGDFVLVDGIDAIVQHLRIRFAFFKGEWFLDAREGTPWHQEILGKKPEPSTVTAIVRKVLSTTPGVIRVNTVRLQINESTRTLTITFVVTTDSGVINSADYTPFIVELT